MIIIKQFNSEGFEKYYVFNDIDKAVLFVSKRCKINKYEVLTDKVYTEIYKDKKYNYIIKLAESRDF